MKVAIVYSPDWRQYAEIEVFALLATNPGVHIYLISSQEGRLNLSGCTFIDIGPWKHKINSTNVDTRFTAWALYRLLLPEIIPDDRVLYIDADALVDGSLQELWSLDLGNGVLAGVVDTGIDTSRKIDLGLRPEDPYINAGVTLLDLAAIRATKGLYKKWLHLINTRHFYCHDQDILNLTCRGHISIVGNEYNSSTSTGFHHAPKIAHFAGAAFDKPWRLGARPRHWEIWKKWSDKYHGIIELCSAQHDALICTESKDHGDWHRAPVDNGTASWRR